MVNKKPSIPTRDEDFKLVVPPCFTITLRQQPQTSALITQIRDRRWCCNGQDLLSPPALPTQKNPVLFLGWQLRGEFQMSGSRFAPTTGSLQTFSPYLDLFIAFSLLY